MYDIFYLHYRLEVGFFGSTTSSFSATTLFLFLFISADNVFLNIRLNWNNVFLNIRLNWNVFRRKMGRIEMDADEEALFDSARISTEKHQCKTMPIVISSPHLETGLLVDDCSLEKPYWPQSYDSSMNLYSRSPLIGTGTCAMEPSLAPGLNNMVPSCKLHQYNGLSDDVEEPLLRSNGLRKVSPNDDSEDHREKNQFIVNAHGHLVLHNSRNRLSSLEIRRSSLFQAVLNGINILAGRPYKIYFRLCLPCANLCIMIS